MKKILKITAAVILSLAVVLAPVGFMLGVSFLAPPQYSDTFYGALDAKYQRLCSIEESKVVVVGGSSVAFGLDSELLEKYTGMPVVNFGLYADLGTKLMLELSRDHIKAGDIVILAPELDAQTLSMYFSWDNTLKAFDDDMSMLGELDRSVDEWLFSIEGFWNLASAKLAYTVDGNKPNPTDVYNANNFNEYGDIDPEKFPRENNILKGHYLAGENYEVNFDPAIVEPEFLEYLNDYILDCKEKEAEVYFTWCPVNDLAVSDPSSEKMTAFENFFRQNLKCEVISSLADYKMESGWFYDTNFHLNDAGVKVRTVKLIKDLARKYENMNVASIDADENVPAEPPEHKYSTDFDGTDNNADFFVFEQTKTGTYKIIGISDLGRTQKALTVPLGHLGKAVTEIDVSIFADSACEKLIIPDGTNLSSMTGSFKGASNLSEICIYEDDPGAVAPPSFSEAPAGLSVHVPSGSDYITHYNWSPVADSFPNLIIEDL